MRCRFAPKNDTHQFLPLENQARLRVGQAAAHGSHPWPTGASLSAFMVVHEDVIDYRGTAKNP